MTDFRVRVVTGLLLVLSLASAERTPQAPSVGDEYPPRHLEPVSDPRTWTVSDVQDWVESVGYYEFREAFGKDYGAGRGIDGRKLLKLTAAQMYEDLVLPSTELADVLQMEIDELKARHGLFLPAELAAFRAAHPLGETLGVDGVVSLLRDAGFERHAPSFAAARIDGKALLRLSEAQVGKLTAQAAGAADAYEHSMADAEQITALIDHLRWRSAGAAARGSKEEL